MAREALCVHACVNCWSCRHVLQVALGYAQYHA
jgi:hypothetical protein